MTSRAPIDYDATVTAATDGDSDAFASLASRHRRELHVHCYRMIGSFEEAEDRVQETFLRAWNKRATFEGRAGYRAWLYRIATNVCLEQLRRRPKIVSRDTGATVPYSAMPWLQPYPDELLDPNPDNEPDAVVVAKETIELAYLAAIQLLPHKQRAVLILRDVLDFSASETASLLDESVAAVNSALQRARGTLRRTQSPDISRAARSTNAEENALLARYMAAHEQMDPAAVIAVLRADARLTISPIGMCWDGRDQITPSFMEGMGALGEFRCVATRANRQPAVANYLRRWGDTEYRAFTIVILGIVDSEIIDMATFANPNLFSAFGLTATLP